MAVSDWSANPVNNTSIGGYSLSGPFGYVFAEMMAQIKAAFDASDADVESVETAVSGIQDEIGSWTDETEATTVKAAIEALRPAPDAED